MSTKHQLRGCAEEDLVYCSICKKEMDRETANQEPCANMTWTTEKPTKEGFYWYRPAGGGHEETVRVFLGTYNRLQFKDTYFDEDAEFVEDASGEWCGPIEPPE